MTGSPGGTEWARSERLASLFDTHWDRLYRLARRLVPCADDALDLVQETFLKAARSAETIPAGSSHEEAWLVRVLINIRRDEWRREAVRKRHAQKVDAPRPPHDAESEFVTRALVWRALDRLSPRRRAIVVMHGLDGLPLPSIASLLGISVITVRWHLSRGRRELARALRVLTGESNEQAQRDFAERRPAASRSSAD